MEPNKHTDIENLLSKFADGSFTETDRNLLYHYIESTHKDEHLNSLLLKHWESLKTKEISIDEARLNLIRAKIEDKINQATPFLTPRRQLSINWNNTFAKAAAILIIPLLITSLYYSYNWGFSKGKTENNIYVLQEIVASPGSRVHFKLPDQTDVWLNSGSKLEFPTSLASNNQRRVKLSGQGYFQVSHDAKHPFFVETNSFTIKVLGTSFDVSCYDNDNTFCSTLEKGSISILNKANKEIGKLVPGEKASIDKANESLSINKVETGLITSWKDGKLIFRNTPLPEVTKQMERWFNCKIDVDSRLVGSDISYTATIQQETIEEVLKMIEISTHVKTKIENRNVKIWK